VRTWVFAIGLAWFMLQCIAVSLSEQQRPGAAASVPQSAAARDQRPDQGEAYTWEDLLSRNPGAIAKEKKVFDRMTDPNLKQRVASILLAVGVRDKLYFDYLAAAAKKALQDDEPWPTLYDESGEINTRASNPVFAEWMRKNGFDPNDPEFTALRGYSPAFLDWCKKNRM
jgi:hypothetical protein